MLAERCEKAGEGDRDLDADIVWAIVPDDDRKVFDGVRHVVAMVGPQGPWFLPLEDRAQDAPCFTRGLDAALTLVPEGHGWMVQRGAYSQVWIGGRRHAEAAAVTPALALAAAALRARAAMEEE